MAEAQISDKTGKNFWDIDTNGIGQVALNTSTATIGSVKITDGTNILSISATGAALVELETGDIEIGAVEIKDGTSDTRAVVTSATINYLNTGLTDGTDIALIDSTSKGLLIENKTGNVLQYGFAANVGVVNTNQAVVTSKDSSGNELFTSIGNAHVKLTDGTDIALIGGTSKALHVTQMDTAGTVQFGYSIQPAVVNTNQQVVTVKGSDGVESDTDVTKTAFGDIRVAEITPIIQNSFEFTVSNTELSSNTETNGGTVTQASGMAVMTSTTTTASVARLESKRHARYRAGLGGLMRFTALYTTGVASTSQWAGIMDETGSGADFKNGYAIGYNGDTFGIARFANDALTFVALSACDDPLDGTGKSGMTIDQTKLNVFAIQYQYLGAGSIKFLVEDDSTGKLVVFHTINYANANTTPSTHNPNFFVMFHVDNKATTSNMVMKTSSYAYFLEGKTEIFETHQPEFSSGRQTISSVSTEAALFTIKNRASYASKTNFMELVLKRLSIGIEANQANNLGEWRLVKDATLGGTPSYSNINTSDSIVEIDTAGTTITGGKELMSGDLAGKNDKMIENISDYKLILGPGESVTLSVISVNDATFKGSLLWKELF